MSSLGEMILIPQRPLLLHHAIVSKQEFIKQFHSNLYPFPLLSKVIFKSRARPFFKCFCNENETAHEASQGFSALPRDIGWDNGTAWSTMGFYIFSLHIPLSFGSLSLVAQLMHRPVLDPQTKVLSMLVVQILEFFVTLLLLKVTAKANFRFRDFFGVKQLGSERNWLFASVIGVGFLFTLVFLTSFLAERVIGSKDVNNPMLKEILDNNNISRAACFVAYCVVTPLLEETVYRGFLLTSISSVMQWQQAVIISSAVFSAAHLSAENSLQLFIIGCILGCSYSWTGDLRSSILIHSLYNALTLILTSLS